MTISSLVFLLALVCTFVLVFLSVRMVRAEAEPGPSTLSRLFLVALRLAIGWHFFIEATEKVHDPSWSSEGYLREATGPLAPTFRAMAGDRVVEQLTLQEDGSLSPELTTRWQAYVDAVVDFYQLDAEQAERAQAALDQAKETARNWLSSRERKVRRATTDDATPVWDDLVMADRLKAYQYFIDEVHRIEATDLGRFGEEAEQEWRQAKARASLYRATLERDLDLLDKELKRNLRTVLLEIAKENVPEAVVPKGGGEAVNYRAKLEKALEALNKKRAKEAVPPDNEWEAVDAQQHKFAEQDLFLYQGVFSELRQAEEFDKLDEQTRRIVKQAIDRQKSPGSSYDLVPYPVGRPLGAWTLLDWGNFLVKWGLLVVGLMLMFGLFTRTACVIGALYLLMFYLAMPALPGWPASPRAEGHYLFINKNIIEMLALLALATFRTGRWAGLDGIFGLFRRPKEEQKELNSSAASRTI